nr:hypothetical protein Iba_chr08eCG12150 [Ipomoea batatas]
MGKTEMCNHPFSVKPHSLSAQLRVTDGGKREAIAAKKGIILGHPAKIRDSYIEAQLRVPDRGKREAIAAMAAKPVLIRVAPPRYGSVNLNCPDK